MKIVELLKDSKIKVWMAEYKNKPNTQRIYLQGMRAYTDYTHKSPTQLIDEAKADIRAGKLMDERAIFEEFTLFNESLIDAGLAPKTRASHVTGVKSFFMKYYIDMPRLRNDKKIKSLEKNKRVPSKEDLQAVLSVSSPLEKCLVLVGCTSGLSAEEVRNLTLEEYFSGYDENDEICTLPLRRTKTEVDFITFLPKETTRAINSYLQYRERELKANNVVKERSLKKQRITRNSKGEATGYLFIREHVPNKYNETKNEELRQVTHNSYMKIFQQISNKAQKNTAYGDWNLIRSHNLRRYFYSALINAGADIFTVDFLSGHAIPESQFAYIVADPKKLKEKYKKYTAYLTIQKDLDISTSPEYQAAIDRAEKAEAEAVRVSVERAELQKLKGDIEELYRRLKNTPEGFDLAAPIMHKLHPKKLLLLPDDGRESEEP
ncbi:tyrosine-type recombinase/integrase [Methanosarcina sp.]|uniref:tyrosine-type recombinase/integrase n=1 Tax=Methanosarcina sp. TaxID=2213 RepID=UPI002CC5D685|nr:tyrosine-type recombinase/integrase [Methanosarcina sp.]HOW15047.1 tyrosine-type recombinase/integrase [Methanosarcina sp.]